jgi:UDP-N-acetylmuramoylalanine--D-glutamate ligase
MKKKHALVLGLGVSGRAAAEFLLVQGYQVTCVEKNQELLATSPEVKRLIQMGLKIAPEGIDLASFDLLIPSPGISPTHPIYQEAVRKKVEVVGEAELAFRHMKQKAIAITGTNGKTTVTLLVEHALKKSGLKARSLGNIGEPLSTYFINSDQNEIVVAEISSYQLETMKAKVFDAAILLNITPDHLDRYASMEEYAKAKCHLQACLKPGAPFFVYEQALADFGAHLSPENLFSYGVHSTSDFWTDKAKVYASEKVEYLLPVEYRDRGSHESENALAAWLLVREFGVTSEQFLEALKSFKKPPHRIEFVTSVNEVAYVDDSKGTNLDAVLQAVNAVEGEVVLIAGGVDKGASYTLWIQPFQGRVKKILALGQAAKKIQEELGKVFEVELVSSMEEAVTRADQVAKKGDTVLLSPGCSSFDMFRDYAHRGDEFKRCVYQLEEKRG